MVTAILPFEDAKAMEQKYGKENFKIHFDYYPKTNQQTCLVSFKKGITNLKNNSTHQPISQNSIGLTTEHPPRRKTKPIEIERNGQSLIVSGEPRSDLERKGVSLFAVFDLKLKCNEKVLQGKECDIVIEDLVFERAKQSVYTGIELNGELYHTAEEHEPEYHFKKVESATKEGIRLLCLWGKDFKHFKHKCALKNFLDALTGRQEKIDNSAALEIALIEIREDKYKNYFFRETELNIPKDSLKFFAAKLKGEMIFIATFRIQNGIGEMLDFIPLKNVGVEGLKKLVDYAHDSLGFKTLEIRLDLGWFNTPDDTYLFNEFWRDTGGKIHIKGPSVKNVFVDNLGCTFEKTVKPSQENDRTYVTTPKNKYYAARIYLCGYMLFRLQYDTYETIVAFKKQLAQAQTLLSQTKSLLEQMKTELEKLR